MFHVQPTPYDLCFRIWGFPVRVHPFFWLVSAFLGLRSFEDMRLGILEMSIWISAVFVSILVHELGHSLAFRHVFHVRNHIALYWLGGLAIPVDSPRKGYGFFGMLCDVFLSFSGPLAGFLLAGILLIPLLMFPSLYVGVNFEEQPVRAVLLRWMDTVFYISVFWGVFNLLPIYPLDGGQISREIFSYFSPRRGIANSLALSMVTAIIAGILLFYMGHRFAPILFLFLAFDNYREMSFRSFRYR